MDNYTENRFGYLRNESNEQLENLVNELNDDIKYWEQVFETTENGNEKTEAHQELNNILDKLSYVEELIKERKGNRTK